MADDFQIMIPVENGRSAGLRVIVEPWAFEITLGPRERCEIVFRGPRGEPAIDVGEDWLAVWGWEGSCAWAIKNGALIEDYRAHPVPSGLISMKEILKSTLRRTTTDAQ